jgi:hypothetical protein
VRDLAVDSCAFRLTGDSLLVEGEHSSHVSELQEEDFREESAVVSSQGSGVRVSYQRSARYFQGVWLPGSETELPLVLWVTHENPDLKGVAEFILLTTRRCAAVEP